MARTREAFLYVFCCSFVLSVLYDTFIDHYLFISQCVSFCSDLNSPLPMDIRYWKEVEAAVGV